MFEQYNTTYGSLLNITKLVKQLTMYVNTNDTELMEYEYVTENNDRCVYITGHSDDERDLPAWEHPIVIDGLKGNRIVVNDVRKYVVKHDEQPASLADVVKDKSSMQFIVLRGLLTLDFITGKQSKHRSVVSASSSAMGVWINGMIGTIVKLSPEEMFHVEITTAMYAHSLYYTNEELEDARDVMIARVINGKHVYKLSGKQIKEILNGYVFNKSDRIKDLIDNINAGIDTDKRQFVTIDSIVGAMGTVWYGPGGSESAIIALENMPTWLAMIYSSINSRTYTKSRIGMLLNKYNRIIDSRGVVKHFDNYLSEIEVK